VNIARLVGQRPELRIALSARGRQTAADFVAMDLISGGLRLKICGGLTSSCAIKAASGRFLDRWSVRFVTPARIRTIRFTVSPESYIGPACREGYICAGRTAPEVTRRSQLDSKTFFSPGAPQAALSALFISAHDRTMADKVTACPAASFQYPQLGALPGDAGGVFAPRVCAVAESGLAPHDGACCYA
jgi:hypothetical protein